MSLIAWWPLNGTLQDYGPNNFNATVINAKWNNDGKIGQCLEMNNSELFYQNDNCCFDKCFSMSIWVKLFKQNEYQTLMKIYNGAAVLDIINQDIRFFIYNNNNEAKILTSKAPPINKWIHITGTYNEKELKLYINGELISKLACSDTPRFFDNKNKYIAVGVREASLGTHNYLNGLVNDVRFYNHALSIKEIKEISKAKILHYNFNDQLEEPTINLYANNPNAYGIEITEDSTCKYYMNKIKEGHYRVRVEKKTNGNHWPNVQFPIYKFKTDTDYSIGIDVKINDKRNCSLDLRHSAFSNDYWSQDLKAISINTSSTWNRYTLTRQFKQEYAKDNMKQKTEPRIEFYLTMPTAEGIVDFEFKNYQVEEKDHATPYIKDKRNYLISDSSGYRNHGLILPDYSPKYIKQSYIGSGCFEFNGKNSYITTNNNSKCKVTENITISVWAFKEKWDDKKDEKLISCTENGGWNFEKLENFIRFSININKTYTLASTSTTNISSGWHMFTGTYDGLNVNFYIDGVLKESKKLNKTNQSITYNEQNSIFVGAEAWSSINRPADIGYLDGKIADVEIYATALSHDDIVNLYNTKVSISTNGKIFTNELNETNNIISKKIIVNACGFPNKGYVVIDGKRYYGDRSWNIVDIDENLNFISNSIYDIYDTNKKDQLPLFISKFNDIQDNHFIVIYTTDQPTQNNTEVIKLLSNYSETIKDYNFNGRCSYYLILRKKDLNIIAEKFVPYTVEGKSDTGETIITLNTSKNVINKCGQVNANDINEISILDMPIKFQHNALWARIYYHNSKSGTVFFSDSDWLKTKQEDKESYLYYLENLKNENNEFELLLQTNETKLYNRWKQTNDFTKPEKREGYIPIHIDFPGRDEAIFGGFRLTNSNATFIDGSLGSNWWFAICPKRKNQIGTPTFPFTDTKGITELWIRIDNIKKNFKMYKNNIITCNEFIET